MADDDPILAALAIPKTLLDAVKKRECVLFLGSGIHAPPPEKSPYTYPEGGRPPLGKSLSHQFADECMADLNYWEKNEDLREKKRKYLSDHREELQRISWYYQTFPPHNRKDLIDKIKDAVEKDKQPSPLVRALAEIDFPVVITTNYDQLFETALRDFQKVPTVRIYDPDGVEPTKDFRGNPESNKPWFFKMHGSITEPNSIVITDEDYIHWVMRLGDRDDFHPVPINLRSKFKEWPTLFVGYSLLDYNLRLLFRTLRRRFDPAELPATFSLDPWPDLLVAEAYGPLVLFIEQDSWKFVPELYQSVLGREIPK
jgi:SIR2-like domain